jgi:type II secretory pathway component PulF
LGSTERITYRDIRVFSQNFYLLKKANFNNIHALSTVIETTENPKLKAILEEILSGVESGEFMYTTMEYYDKVFPYIYINMIKVGELSGSLETSLQQGVKYLDDSDSLNKKLKKILLPNIMMFIGIIVLLFAAVIFGVPMLEGVFEELGAEADLPAITMWFAGVVDLLMIYWYIPVGIFVAIFAAVWSYIHTPRGRYNFDYFKYTMPIFGKLIYLLDFSRLMKAVLLNLQNGMRIQDALEVSKNVVKNTVMLSIIETSINNIFTGDSWIEPFENAKLSSAMTTEMLKIGMQTDLTEMIAKLLEYMDQDIDNTMEKIMKVLPEVSYLLVGIVLIFFVVVVLVPCIQMYMGNFLFDAYGV